MIPIKRNISYQFKDFWLRMQIRWADHRLLLWVGYEVDRSDDKGRPKWDGRRCRQNSTHGPQKIPAAVINKELDNLETKVGEVFYTFELTDKVPRRRTISKPPLRARLQKRIYGKLTMPSCGMARLSNTGSPTRSKAYAV